MIWFTADTHFGHEEILNDPRRGTNRPFKSVQEMDEALIENWNVCVKPDDMIYVLGDFAVRDVEKYLKRLNGFKVLIKGNHDPDGIDTSNRCGFLTVYTILYTRLQRDFVMCHYPMREWMGCYRGVIHLHGHVHGKWMPIDAEWDLNRLDVGVDTNDFFPYSIEEVFDILKERNEIFQRYEVPDYRGD